MGRPRKHESNAAKAADYVARNSVLRISLPGSKLDEIATLLDTSRAALVAAMVRFAVASPAFADCEFPGRHAHGSLEDVRRLDVPRGEFPHLSAKDVGRAIRFALTNRQWRRFGLHD